MTETPL